MAKTIYDLSANAFAFQLNQALERDYQKALDRLYGRDQSITYLSHPFGMHPWKADDVAALARYVDNEKPGTPEQESGERILKQFLADREMFIYQAAARSAICDALCYESLSNKEMDILKDAYNELMYMDTCYVSGSPQSQGTKGRMEQVMRELDEKMPTFVRQTLDSSIYTATAFLSRLNDPEHLLTGRSIYLYMGKNGELQADCFYEEGQKNLLSRQEELKLRDDNITYYFIDMLGAGPLCSREQRDYLCTMRVEDLDRLFQGYPGRAEEVQEALKQYVKTEDLETEDLNPEDVSNQMEER